MLNIKFAYCEIFFECYEVLLRQSIVFNVLAIFESVFIVITIFFILVSIGIFLLLKEFVSIFVSGATFLLMRLSMSMI